MPRIHTIDLEDHGVPGCIASYLVTGSGEPVIVETGPSATLPALRRGLERLGLDLDEIRHVLVTHIHFDHAGGAGHLARAGKTVHVHEFGAQHLVEPERLVASARRIYGDDMDQRWGPIAPAPPDRVAPTRDGDVLHFGDVTITAVETPGHARHHIAWRLETDEGPVCFTGDAAACSIEGSTYISLPTPPPEFDRDAWLRSLDRLEAENFVALYPTHFGRMDDPGLQFERVRAELDETVRLIEGLVERGTDEAEIYRHCREHFGTRATREGVPPEKHRFFAGTTYVGMNVTGILRALRGRTAASATNGGHA